MKDLISAEFMKLKRYNIFFISIIGFIASTIFGIFQVTQTPDIDKNNILFSEFANCVTSNNMFLIAPFVIVLIGGFIFKREYENDTMKTLLTIPVSTFDLIIAKLVVTIISSVCFFVFSFIITILAAFFIHAQGITVASFIGYFIRFFMGGITIFIVVLPILATVIVLNKGYFLSVIIALFYGCVGIYTGNSRMLASLYPVTAGYGVLESIYKTMDFMNYNYIYCYLILIFMIIIAVIIFKLGKMNLNR